MNNEYKSIIIMLQDNLQRKTLRATEAEEEECS